MEIIVYIAIFISVYVQIFFLLTFLESKKNKQEKEKEISDENIFPTVTFLVPCWNEEKTLSDTVFSIKSLDYPKDKVSIFLINDGSTDNTWQVMKSFENDPQVKIFSKENGLKWSALNYGLKYVESELVSSVDADTCLNKDALKNIVYPFIKDREIAAVGGNVLIKDPQTISQKAQSIEYQMFSFNKKMLAILGGVLVVPGAFSMFKMSALKEVGGWETGYNLEDMELTFRLQTKGYKVEHSHNATAFTSGPKTLRTLFKQRIRWGYGFLNNAYAYRFAFFNKKFGNFGFFTLPSSFILYFTIMAIFVSWYKMIIFFYDKYLIWKLIGFGSIFDKFSYNFFYTNTKAIVFLSFIAFLFFLINIILGRRISNIKDKNMINVFYFFVIYGFIVPLWIVKSTWNSIISVRPSWR